MAIKSRGVPISPQQMMNQWRHIPHIFQVNVRNFEARVGMVAQEVFQGSFDLKRLNSTGSTPWRARKDTKPHPILNETSSLKNSITWRHVSSSKIGGVQIYTDPKGFKNTARHRGFCYAAIHNAPSGTYTYGKHGGPSIQRQYIGHSSVLKDKIKELSYIIFTDFPK